MLKLLFVLASALVSVVVGGIGGLLFDEFAPWRCAGHYACGYGQAFLSMMVGLGVALICFVVLLVIGLRKRAAKLPPNNKSDE